MLRNSIGLIVFTLSAFMLFPIPCFAEIKTITHTIQQPFGGSQSPDDARIAGIARAKREALEQFGTYIESVTVVKESRVESDEILALTAGVAKAEVIKQKNYTDGDAFGIEITVKVDLDTTVLDKSLKRLLDDRDRLKDLIAAREREKRLLARIADLEVANRREGRTKQQADKLKNEFLMTNHELAAIEWYDKALKVLSSDISRRDPQKAIEYLTQAILFDPFYVDAIKLRGVAFCLIDQDDYAIDDFSQVIQMDPNNLDGYIGRGVIYSSQGKHTLAIADFDRAIFIDSNSASAYSGRANSKLVLKQVIPAIADYDQAIRINHKDAISYKGRGLAKLMLYNAKEGCFDLLKACKLGVCDSYNFARGKICN